MLECLDTHSGAIQAIATMILVVITAGYACFTHMMVMTMRKELDEHQKQSKGNLLFNLNEAFFSKRENREIIKSVEEKQDIFGARPSRKFIEIIDEYDLDYYLGYFELMSNFEEFKILDLEYIDSIFGHYIENAYKNQEIKNYIEELRKKYDKEYFGSFEILAQKIIKKEEQKKEV